MLYSDDYIAHLRKELGVDGEDVEEGTNNEKDMCAEPLANEQGDHFSDLLKDFQNELAEIIISQQSDNDRLKLELLLKDNEKLKIQLSHREKENVSLVQDKSKLVNQLKKCEQENKKLKEIIENNSHKKEQKEDSQTLNTKLKDAERKIQKLTDTCTVQLEKITSLQNDVIQTNNSIIKIQQNAQDQNFATNEKLLNLNNQLADCFECKTSVWEKIPANRKSNDRLQTTKEIPVQTKQTRENQERNKKNNEQNHCNTAENIQKVNEKPQYKTNRSNNQTKRTNENEANHEHTTVYGKIRPNTLLVCDNQLKNFESKRVTSMNIDTLFNTDTQNIKRNLQTKNHSTIIIHNLAEKLKSQTVEKVVQETKTLVENIKKDNKVEVIISLPLPVNNESMNKKIKTTNKILEEDVQIKTINHANSFTSEGYVNCSLYVNWFSLGYSGLRKFVTNLKNNSTMRQTIK